MDLRPLYTETVCNLSPAMNSSIHAINMRVLRRCLGILALLLFPAALFANPVVNTLTVNSASTVFPSQIVASQLVTFTGSAIESDGRLSQLDFYVWGPGYTAWAFVGSLPASGGGSGGTVRWIAPSGGSWQVKLVAWGDSNTTSGSLSTPFTVTAFAFKVLIDTNEITAQEAYAIINTPGILAADGVWGLAWEPGFISSFEYSQYTSMPPGYYVNPVGFPTYLTYSGSTITYHPGYLVTSSVDFQFDSAGISNSPPAPAAGDLLWNTLFTAMGAQKWLVAETDGIDQACTLPSGYQNPNNVLAFNEDTAPETAPQSGYFTIPTVAEPNPTFYDTTPGVLKPNYPANYYDSNGTKWTLYDDGVNPDYELPTLVRLYANRILLESRTYTAFSGNNPINCFQPSGQAMIDAMAGIQRNANIPMAQQVINDNAVPYYNPGGANIAGVAFEFSPEDYSYNSNTQPALYPYNLNLLQGVQDVLNKGLKCYLLLPATGTETNYLLAVQNTIAYFNATGELNNPNLYIVLADYNRPYPPNSSIPAYPNPYSPTTCPFFLNVDNPTDTTQDTNTFAAALAWLNGIR
jgi:hypothetical protein